MWPFSRNNDVETINNVTTDKIYNVGRLQVDVVYEYRGEVIENMITIPGYLEIDGNDVTVNLAIDELTRWLLDGVRYGVLRVHDDNLFVPKESVLSFKYKLLPFRITAKANVE